MSNEPERLLTLTEAARYLSVSRRTLQNWVWARKVPFVKLGPAPNAPVRFRPEALRAWLAEHEVLPLGVPEAPPEGTTE